MSRRRWNRNAPSSVLLASLTERAPVIRALWVRVAGLRRWYPVSGVELFNGFKMVSKLPEFGALIEALRAFTRGGVDSQAILSLCLIEFRF